MDKDIHKDMGKVNRINIAYIDSANLDKAHRLTLLWKLNYRKFRVWLSDKYGVQKAYIFIGLIPKFRNLYTYLQDCGFILVFKDVIYDSDAKPKGNCDSDLIVQACTDLFEGNLNQAVIVASDGDYAPLIKTLISKDKLKVILSPSPPRKCSILLKRTGARISYICEQRLLLEEEINPREP